MTPSRPPEFSQSAAPPAPQMCTELRQTEEVVTFNNGGQAGESSEIIGNTKDDDNEPDRVVSVIDHESLCISDLSALVQNNYNEYFNITKENEQLKNQLKTYTNLCSKQVKKVTVLELS